jgi:hypothetical protein
MEALPLYRWRAIVNLMTATLAHIQQRYTLLAICNECANTVELDVDGLVGTLGPDHPVPAIKNRISLSTGPKTAEGRKRISQAQKMRWQSIVRGCDLDHSK